MMRTLFAALLCAGCTTTTPLRTADSTYTVSARVPSSGESDAKAEAFEEASHFCASRGASVQLLSSDAHECALQGGCGDAQITFLCAMPH